MEHWAKMGGIMMNCSFAKWLTDERRLVLFPAGTTVKDSHYRKSTTRREQNLNLRRNRVQALLSKVVQL